MIGTQYFGNALESVIGTSSAPHAFDIVANFFRQYGLGEAAYGYADVCADAARDGDSLP